MVLYGGNGFEIDTPRFGLRVSRGDYVLRVGTLAITKLMADWFVEGRSWGWHRRSNGFITVCHRDPSYDPYRLAVEDEGSSPPTHH